MARRLLFLGGMRRSHVLGPLRFSLLAAMGVSAVACGSNVTIDDGSGGSGGSGANGGDGGDGGIGGSGAGQTGGGGGSALCDGATPIDQSDGSESGFAQCPDGTVHRYAAVACHTEVSTPTCQGTEQYFDCETDADCNAKPNGKCGSFEYFDFESSTACGCVYPCETDADCGSGEICLCDGVDAEGDRPSSTCVSSNCETNADCASGECGLSSWNDGCGQSVQVACRSAADVCRLDGDCEEDWEECGVGYNEGTYTCQSTNCAIGRPLLVDGEARVARPNHRRDWQHIDGAVDLALLSTAERDALARRWTEVAALEHASVASFARFSLQLMAIGAPAEFLVDAQRAGLDEVEHAKIAYSLASAYSGADLGPAALDLSGMEIVTDEREVLRGLIEEACVGETLGVAEALAAAGEVRDPVVASHMRRIATDEQRHAELAWRVLRWMVARADADTRMFAQQVMHTTIDAAAITPSFECGDAPELGLWSADRTANIRRQALREVVAPCAAALFATA